MIKDFIVQVVMGKDEYINKELGENCFMRSVASVREKKKEEEAIKVSMKKALI